MSRVVGGLGQILEYRDIEIGLEGDGAWVGLVVGRETADDGGNHAIEGICPHSPKRSAYALAMENASINDEGRWN